MALKVIIEQRMTLLKWKKMRLLINFGVQILGLAGLLVSKNLKGVIGTRRVSTEGAR